MTERTVRVTLVGDATSLVAAAQQATRALGDLARVNLGGVQSGIQSTTRVVQQATGQVGGWGQALKTGLSVVGIGSAFEVIKQGLTAVISTGMGYEQSMNMLQAVSGATAAQMGAVGDKAKELGADLSLPGASAQSATAAMVELAKGGMNVQQSMDAARGTILLAAAAQIDAATAAQFETAALNTFGLAADQAGKVADILANSANASAASITDIAMGMQQAGTVAAAFGWSLQDTTTMLGLMSNAGINGSDAGTSLKTTLTALLNPTNAQSSALERLGVQTKNANGTMISAEQFTTQLAAAKARMTDAEFSGLVAQALGQDAMRTGLVAAQAGTVGYDNMYSSVGKLGGAQTVAAANSQGLSGALDRIASAAGGVAIALYETLSPALTGIVDAGATVIGWVANAVGWFGKLPGPIKMGAAALLAVIVLKGPFMAMMGAVAASAWQAAYSVGAAGGLMATSMRLVGVAAKGLVAALGGPFGIAIIGVTTALSFLTSGSDDAAASTAGLAAAVDSSTGAFLDNGAAIVAHEAASSGALEKYKALGGSTTDYVQALMGVPEAQQRVNDLLNQYSVEAGVAAGGGSEVIEKAVMAADVNKLYQASLVTVTNAQREGKLAAEAAGGATTTLTAAQQAAATVSEEVAKAVDKVNEAMGNDTSAIAFKDRLAQAKTATEALDLASQALTVTLLGVDGGMVAAGKAQRDNAADMRGITGAARAHESALAGVATAQEALDKLLAHGTNTPEDIANAQKSADKAAKDVLTSQMDLVKTQQDAAQSIQDAREAAAKQQADDAKTEKTDRADILKAQIDADKNVKDAEDKLAKDKAEGQKKVAEEKAAAEKDRLATVKALADAQGELSKARDSAAREIALAQARVDKLAGNKRYTAADRADAARRLADAKALGRADVNAAQGKVTDVQTTGNESAATHRASVGDAMSKNAETITADQQAVRDARGKGAEALAAAKQKLADDQAKAAEDQIKSARSIADANESAADSVASAQQRVIDATDGATAAQQALAEEQAKSVPDAAAIADAQRTVADAQARAADTGDAEADALDKAGQAGRDAAAAAYIKAGGDDNLVVASAAAGVEMEKQRQTFIDNAIQAGYSADEAKRLADNQGLIPKDVVTAYSTSGHEGAVAKAKEIQDAVDKIPGVKTIHFIAVGDMVIALPIASSTTGTTREQDLANAIAIAHGYQPYDYAGANANANAANHGYAPYDYGTTLTPGHAAGGYITGPGGPTDDQVNAHLSNGEFVVNAAQAAKHRQLLEDINNGVNGYAAGGAVGGGAAVGAPDTSVVDKAWGGISSTMKDAWGNDIGPTLDELNAATLQTGTNFSDLDTEFVGPSWSANADTIKNAVNASVLPDYATLNTGTAGVGQANVDLRDLSVNPAWQGIQATVTNTAGALTAGTFPTMVAGLQGLGNTGRTLATDTGSSWGSIGTSISTAYTNHVAPAWTAVQGFSTATGAFFGGINTGMTTSSGSIGTNLRTITTAIDNFFKLVDGKAPAPANPATVPGTLPALADGGMITQGTGPRSDDVHIRASKGEYVVNAKSTANHRAELDKINYGGKYADGGEIGSKIGDRVSKAIQGGAEKAISAGVDRILGSVAAGLGSTITGGDVDPTTSRGKFLAAVASKMGTAYVWGAAGPDVFDCSGLMSWALEAAGVGKGRLTADQFNDSFPHVTTPRPGDLVTFDTGRLDPGDAGHVGAVMDPSKGLMMQTDGDGPAKVATYIGRDGGPLAFVDVIGGSYVPYIPKDPGAKPGDPPSAGWLAAILAKIAAGGTGPSNGLIVGPPGQWGTTRPMNTVDPVQDFGAMNMAQGTAAAVGPVPPGGALERWRPLYLHAMGMLGKPVDAIDKMMYQMFRESSGNPLSYAYDSNYTHGHPSKGLLQTIPSTFKSNAPAGYNTNIWDPLSNALASLVYIGDPHNYPGGAYDNGGFLQPGWNFNGLNAPEPVLTDSQWAVASRALNYTVGGGASVVVPAPVVEVRNYLDGTQIDARTEVLIDGVMQNLGTTLTRMAAQS